MKQTILLIIIFHSAFFCFSQSGMAFIKKGLKTVNAYDSTKKSLLVTLNNETYFSCDSLKGNWYKFDMPFYFEGFIHKDSIQFFQNLSKPTQKQKINKALNYFYSICNSEKEIQDSIYNTLRQSYYTKTFYPILKQLFNYYKETKDTATLLNLLNVVKCNPDGEFATTSAFLIGYCYDLDKRLFARQIIQTKDKQNRKQLTNILLASAKTFYRDKYSRKKIDANKIETLLANENATILQLTKASR